MNKIFTLIILTLLTLSAFFIRSENIKHTQVWTIDEIVYARMAGQMLYTGFAGYNTIPYGNEMAAEGRPLHDYFFQPLFKHPPVFCFLILFFFKFFGINFISAALPSLLSGVLMIPLTYFFAKLLFDRRTAILAALFVWIDPVSIISSQKIWMDTTLSFFMLLAVYWYTYALKRKKAGYFILAGAASGLATLTKYPGILTWAIIVLFSASFHREIFKKKLFLVGCFLPFVMLLPWLGWNLSVYGMDFLTKQAGLHEMHLASMNTQILLLLGFLGIGLLGFFVMGLNKRKSQQVLSEDAGSTIHDQLSPVRRIFINIIGIVFLIFNYKYILYSFNIFHQPAVSWEQGLFYGATSLFYIQKLIEWSPIFILAFLSFFINKQANYDQKLILFVSAGIIFFFFMTYGAYQSRYILPAIPFLIILGTQLWLELFDRVTQSENTIFYFGGRLLLRSLLFFIILKSININAVLSFGNDMCYF